MTYVLEPVEKLFRMLAVATGQPWPCDRYLGALARARVSVMLAERLHAEACARAAVLEDLQRELRDVVARADRWTLVAEELVRVAAIEKDRSPWGFR